MLRTSPLTDRRKIGILQFYPGLTGPMQLHRLRRREFITLLGGAAAIWPLAARAQQPAMPVIGYLGGYASNAPYLAPFRDGLGETGYVEGKNAAIEYRWVAGQNDRLSAILHDLIERRVAVIAAVISTADAIADKAATQTIPIVFRNGSDPVANGLVAALNRPGANVTGITTLGNQLGQKRLQMLHELLPTGAAVALLVNPRNANATAEVREMQAAANALDVHLLILNASNPSEIDTAFTSIGKQDIGGLLTTADPLLFAQRDQIVTLVARRAIPAIYIQIGFSTKPAAS